MDVLRKQANMPEWLTYVMKEFTKPPYFLENLYTQTPAIHKPNGHTFIPHTNPASSDNAAPSDKTFGSSQSPDSTGDRTHSFSDRPNQRVSAEKNRVANPIPRRESSAYNHSAQPASRPEAQQEFVATHANVGVKGAGKSVSAWQTVFRKANLPVSLAKAYGWNVKRAQSIANVVRVETKGATFILKSTHLSPRRVEFLQRVFAHLEEQGFTRFAPFVLTKQNRNPYVVRKDQTYYGTAYIPGNPSNFASLQQVGLVAQTLARFHDMTRGFESEGYSPPMEYGLSAMLRKRTEDLRALLVRAEAHSPTDQFDKLFLSLGPQLRADAESSIRHIEDEKCEKFLAKDSEYPGLCHLDVIPGNFIYSQQQVMYAIDFDLATYAPRVLDLSHLLRRSLQKQQWRSEVAYTCFVQYNDVKTISSEEYQLIHAMLAFPYRAWRLAHTRYRVLQDAMQTEELRDYADQEERRQNFLTEYARQISHL
jgi:CotS family spore coat protein